MPRSLIIAAGTVGFLSVGLGAFGAHALDGALNVEQAGWWRTATLYGLVHSAAAFSASTRESPYALSGWLFITGSMIFCGTLYAMALGAPRILGAVTPLGGIAFLAGWANIIVSALRKGP